MKRIIIIYLTLIVTSTIVKAADSTLLPLSQVWKYEDSNALLANTWIDSDFDDSAWLFGSGEFGFGDGDETTNVGSIQTITTYFRTDIAISNPLNFQQLLLRLKCDDGAIVYLNGSEIFWTNFKSKHDLTNLNLGLTMIH